MNLDKRSVVYPSTILWSILVAILSACTSRQEPFIDLNALTPISPSASRDTLPLRVAVSAVISPQGTVESYAPLLEYIEATLGRPVELVQRSTYAEVNDLVEMGEVDVAFVCTGAYLIGELEFGMQILVAPVVNGEAAYHSWLIVPSDSPAQSITDLRGKTFAFTDPLSHTGRLYPTYLIYQMGERPETFFGRTFFTYSHDAAIQAVASGLADGAAVDSLIYTYLVQREPGLEKKLRIIHKSPPFGIPPIVVSPSIRPQLRAELQAILLEMHKDPQGQDALAILDIDQFIILENNAYDTARDLEIFLGSIATETP
ncbi:MAG: phosphate/phosphite/phosphonate ABC transporter substrate-binding protein [Anaerolineaceae bacterium]|nr:MAG: phosphate/phosphite/phosphonate ABC transporter substrate-binding protein [Anaerolineaceae bacterium]